MYSINEDSKAHQSQSNQSNNDDAKWSAKDANEVMSFYGLTSLRPDIWNDYDINQRITGSMIMSDLVRFAQSDTLDTIPMNTSNAGNSASALAPNGIEGNAADNQPTATSLQLQEEEDPLGIKGNINRLYGQARTNTNKLQLYSKHFDPVAFLKEVHYDTNYADLLNGRTNLEESVIRRDETLRSQVKQNFDRFVTAKNSIDSMFLHLKKGAFKDDQYGLADFEKSLEDTLLAARPLLRPIIESIDAEDELSRRISVLEQHRELFRCPASMAACMEQGQLVEAVPEYRRAKIIYLDLVSREKIPSVALLWQGIEARKEALQQALLDAMGRVDKANRLLDLMAALGQLESEIAPFEAFLQGRKQHILALLTRSFDAFFKEDSAIATASSQSDGTTSPWSSTKIPTDWKACLVEVIQLLRRERFRDLATVLQNLGFTRHQLLLQAITEATAVLEPELCCLRQLALAVLDHAAEDRSFALLIKASSVESRNALEATCVETFEEILAFFTDKFTQCFSQLEESAESTDTTSHTDDALLSDSQEISSTTENKSMLYKQRRMFWLRIGLIGKAFYAVKFHCRLTDSYATLRNALENPDWLNRFFAFLDAWTDSCIDDICSQLEAVAKGYAYCEDWSLDAELGDVTFNFRAFRHLTDYTYKCQLVLASFSCAEQRTDEMEGRTFRSFLLLLNAFDQLIQDDHKDAQSIGPKSKHAIKDTSTLARLGAKTDRVELRILLLLNNCILYDQIFARKMESLCQTYREVALDASICAELADAFSGKKTWLIKEFLHHSLALPLDILRIGLLQANYDYEAPGHPSGPRNYLIHALKALVSVHAQITQLSSGLLPELMPWLVESFVQGMQDLLKEIPVLGMAGYGQLRTEVLFLRAAILGITCPTITASPNEQTQQQESIDIAFRHLLIPDAQQSNNPLQAEDSYTAIMKRCFDDLLEMLKQMPRTVDFLGDSEEMNGMDEEMVGVLSKYLRMYRVMLRCFIRG